MRYVDEYRSERGVRRCADAIARSTTRSWTLIDLERIRADGAGRIHALRVEVGTLSGVAPEALEAGALDAKACPLRGRAFGADREGEGRELVLRDMEVT